MQQQLDSIKRICLETFGLTVVMGVVTVIAAYHYFDGFGFESARSAAFFSLGAIFVSAVPIQIYIIARISALRADNTQLFDRATRDGLTRVLNKTTFQAKVESELRHLGRRQGDGQFFTLLILDADHFKRINDRLGHATGDQALIAIAATLRRSLRQDDIVGRIGGEEFAILLRNAGYEEARLVAERLRLAIHGLTVGPSAQPTRLSVSLGGVTFQNALPYDMLYRAADANLYKAKKNGRNRVDIANLVRLVRQTGDNRGATGALTRETSGIVVRDGGRQRLDAAPTASEIRMVAAGRDR
ncbi:hypothetical protein Sa4125_46810 [Aureimonas sp. SA4125]|uniref:GGDEF domain-containing protein n=1 Tax=Aureimonas sp. SA4125 TaxID=2826993 RepID=UPI001CC5D05E|nr:GGDEF domain-containing protein [Aureimonas sp. SA4125]BDA87139.1 hypothetical protein Sa4125_46810 [Aureimonas sp. SA4125]